ncbi:hypothetical protein C8Q77DRAFT_115208 [Trametes polyzona]|nr:hypothetical protein C8Q77DRAFT_115208 [Trametes polyzona]
MPTFLRRVPSPRQRRTFPSRAFRETIPQARTRANIFDFLAASDPLGSKLRLAIRSVACVTCPGFLHLGLSCVRTTHVPTVHFRNVKTVSAPGYRNQCEHDEDNLPGTAPVSKPSDSAMMGVSAPIMYPRIRGTAQRGTRGHCTLANALSASRRWINMGQPPVLSHRRSPRKAADRSPACSPSSLGGAPWRSCLAAAPRYG